MIRRLVAPLLAATLALAPAARAGIEVQWLGHATVRIVSEGGKVIVIDPYPSINPKTPVEYRDVEALGPVDLLKVGHHGSRTATGEALLARIRPEAAVVSLGRNRYGHPAPETMARLAAARTRVWRTDREGPVTMTTDGRTFTVRGERTHATFDAADP